MFAKDIKSKINSTIKIPTEGYIEASEWKQMFLAKEQDNKKLHDEVKQLNENINECQKRESSLKDQFEVARQAKEKLVVDSQNRE